MGNIGKISKISGLGDAVGAINALVDAVARLTPVESPSVKPSYTGSGISYQVKPAKVKSSNVSKDIKKLFDLEIKDKKLYVTTYDQSSVYMLGGSRYVDIGENVTTNYDEDYARWEITLASQQAYIYLELNRQFLTAKMICKESMPACTDKIDYIPLWFIDSTPAETEGETTYSVNLSNCIDLRSTVIMSGMS